MKKTISVLMLSFVALYSLSGCQSKGFNRGELQNLAGTKKPVFDDNEIKEAYKKKPNLPKPFKMAVYFASPTGMQSSKWRWTDSDKAKIAELTKELNDQKVVSDVFPLLDSTVSGTDLRSLRLAAAKHQADALLLIGGAGSTDRYMTNWGLTYILLAPVFFVPGSKVDTLFIANATLWDVKNEYLYLTAEAEAMTDQTYIGAFSPRDQDLFLEAKTQAIDKLKNELLKMVQGNKL